MLGDRWTLLILRELFYGVHRFDDLQVDLNAPRQALADRLARLLAKGLVERRSYQYSGHRARSEYWLTARAQTLIPVFISLMNWGEADSGVDLPIRLVDRQTGSGIRMAILDDDSNQVPPDQIRIELKQ
ncbi:MAG: winged helix-turn-helix transcriptional regulator [Caulobacteraceae bacterium]